ncbi:hypothetical protein GTQ99_18005, partial [Kineococcus sp. T13]
RREPVDVVVDAGRLGADPLVLPLLRESAVVVLVVRADVSGVLHARERLRALATSLRRADGLLPRIGVVRVGPLRRGDEEVAQLLRSVGDRVDDFGRLPLDPAGAAVFDGARTARPERTALVRAGRTLVGALATAAGAGARPVLAGTAEEAA